MQPSESGLISEWPPRKPTFTWLTCPPAARAAAAAPTSRSVNPGSPKRSTISDCTSHYQQAVRVQTIGSSYFACSAVGPPDAGESDRHARPDDVPNNGQGR